MIGAFAADHGQTVIAAKTGVEALAILDSGRVVDIVIADSSLPGMSGPELIARCRTRRPGLAALLVSAKLDPSAKGDSGETATLAKPFGRDAFYGAIETALGYGANRYSHPAASRSCKKQPDSRRKVGQSHQAGAGRRSKCYRRYPEQGVRLWRWGADLPLRTSVAGGGRIPGSSHPTSRRNPPPPAPSHRRR